MHWLWSVLRLHTKKNAMEIAHSNIHTWIDGQKKKVVGKEDKSWREMKVKRNIKDSDKKHDRGKE